jgi:hypothetical protein
VGGSKDVEREELAQWLRTGPPPAGLLAPVPPPPAHFASADPAPLPYPLRGTLDGVCGHFAVQMGAEGDAVAVVVDEEYPA